MSKNAKAQLNKIIEHRIDEMDQELDQAMQNLEDVVGTLEANGIRIVGTDYEQGYFGECFRLYHPHINDLMTCGDVDRILNLFPRGTIDYHHGKNAFIVRDV